MESEPSARFGFDWVKLLVGMVIFTLAGFVSIPHLRNFKIKGEIAHATSNARQMALSLSEFESDYGRYPDRSTVRRVIDATETKMNLQGDSSNAYFRQLIATGVIKSEIPFYSKAPYTKVPDDDYSGTHALVKGEVGYGYIMAGDAAIDTKTPGRVTAVTPLLDALADGRFDSETFDGKAVLLFVDSSVKQVNIRPSDKKAILDGGNTLLQTGPDTVWGTTIQPVIKPPEK